MQEFDSSVEGGKRDGKENKELYSGQFERMTEHIYRLTFPFVFSKLWPFYTVPVACFLVHDPNTSRYSLIDVGPQNCNVEVVNALCKFFDRDYEISKKKIDNEQAYKALNKIDHVCLTHFHNGHCWGLNSIYELSKKEMKIFLHEKELSYVREGKKFNEQESESSIFSFSKHFFKNPKLGLPCESYDGIMNDYSHKDEPRHCLCYCHCPGHTEGHSCFYHEEDRALICGGL